MFWRFLLCFGCVLAVLCVFFAVFWQQNTHKTHIKRENETETQFKTQVVDVCFGGRKKQPLQNSFTPHIEVHGAF